MSAIIHFTRGLFAFAFRLSALTIVVTVLAFPAFKGVWLGYVPVALGLVVLGILGYGYQCITDQIIRIPSKVFCWALFVIPAVIQTILIVLFRSHPTFDGLFVYREAVTLVETGAMNPLTYYAPGQVWYFAGFFKVFGTSYLVAQFCQIPLAAAIPVVGYRIAGHVMSEPRARLAAALMALYPGLLLYILVTPYYFYMYTLTMMLVIWSWLRLLKRSDDYTSAAWGGIAAGWGALTKATLLVAPIQAIFFLIVASGVATSRKRWTAWLIFTLLMVLVIAPWAYRNKQVFGETVLICTSGPLVFYSANNPESDGLYSPIPDQARIHTPQEMLEHGAWCNEQAWTFIKEQPGPFAYLVVMKVLHTWGTETSFVELINRNRAPLGVLDPAMRFVVQIGWAALVFALLYVVAMALWRRHPLTAIEIATGIVVLSKLLIYSVYEGGARHHLPAVPFLIIFVLALWSAWPQGNPQCTPGDHGHDGHDRDVD